ncbi:MAG: PilZ domain-containing protein [Nitrospinae bacterium]|nr:PilZ domain-containing protein [Nitrospinota bacterium]
MFSVGMRVLLRAGGRERRVRVRAVREGGWALVDFPHGFAPSVDEVEVIVLREGELIHGRSRILGPLSFLDLLALAPPETVSATPIRKSGRIPLVAPVRARREEEPFDGTLRDLSREGMRLSCERDLAVGDRIALSLWYYDQPQTGPLAAEVRRIVERPSSLEYGMALLPGEGRREYAAFVERIAAALPALGCEWGRSSPDAEPPYHGPCVLTIDHRQFHTRIDGGREGRYLLTDPPVWEGRPLVAPARNRLDATIGYLEGGIARAFDTTLLGQFTAPTPVWVWAWPDTVRVTSLRQSPRIAVFLAAPVAGEEGRRLATAVDLSEEGALLMEAEDAPLSLARVGFILSDGKVVDPLAVTVRRTFARGGARFSGVSFEERTGEPYRRLGQFYAAARTALGQAPIR